jgi:hypothetical protein
MLTSITSSTINELIDQQPFSTGVFRETRVLQMVPRSYMRDHETYIYKHHVFTFMLVCVYINNNN